MHGPSLGIDQLQPDAPARPTPAAETEAPGAAPMDRPQREAEVSRAGATDARQPVELCQRQRRPGSDAEHELPSRLREISPNQISRPGPAAGLRSCRRGPDGGG